MEVEHRVGNNLQVLPSLVGLQLKEAADKAVRDARVSIHARILGMSLVHDQLFKADTSRYPSESASIPATADYGGAVFLSQRTDGALKNRERKRKDGGRNDDPR
jgi:hypothetical protein